MGSDVVILISEWSRDKDLECITVFDLGRAAKLMPLWHPVKSDAWSADAGLLLAGLRGLVNPLKGHKFDSLQGRQLSMVSKHFWWPGLSFWVKYFLGHLH